MVLCTGALFFSGYVIQQRTLRDLRAAIKPREPAQPSPKIYLPDYFKKPTTQLEDGTIVEIDDPRLTGIHNGPKGDNAIIVRPSFPKDEPEQQKPTDPEDNEPARDFVGTQSDADDAASKQKPISRAERRRLIKEEIRRLSEGQEPVYYQRRLW